MQQAWVSALTYERVFGVSSKMSPILLIKFLTFTIFTLSLALTSLFTNSFLVIALQIEKYPEIYKKCCCQVFFEKIWIILIFLGTKTLF